MPRIPPVSNYQPRLISAEAHPQIEDFPDDIEPLDISTVRAAQPASIDIDDLFDKTWTPSNRIQKVLEGKLLRLACPEGYVRSRHRQILRQAILATVPQSGIFSGVKSALGIDRKSELIKALDKLEPAELNKKLLGCLGNTESYGEAANLLRLGADVVLRDQQGQEVHVGFIACRSDHENLWRVWCEHPDTDVNVRYHMGLSPLLLAIGNNQIERVKKLLEKKANPEAANTQGITPLVAATAMRQYRILRPLMRAGANPLRPCSAGGSALEYADDISSSILIDEHSKRQHATHPESLQAHIPAPLSDKDVSMAGAFLQGKGTTRVAMMMALTNPAFSIQIGRRLSVGQADRILDVMLGALEPGDPEYEATLNPARPAPANTTKIRPTRSLFIVKK